MTRVEAGASPNAVASEALPSMACARHDRLQASVLVGITDGDSRDDRDWLAHKLSICASSTTAKA